MINPSMPWSERLALIEHYKPTDAVACKVFNITQHELDVAKQLHKQGTFVVKKHVDATKYAQYFVAGTNSTIHARPESASRKIKPPMKRGRKGDKITAALLAVPTTPVEVESFSSAHNVSVAVLRQSKRFVQNQGVEVAAAVGTIVVRKDRTTGKLMIWKETL